MSTADFAARLRNRQPVLGYWSVIDSPVSTEWLAHIGWDYIALDLQHGLIGYDGMLRGLTAIDSAHGPAGMLDLKVGRGGRVVEGGSLENCCRGNSTESSNLSLSATPSLRSVVAARERFSHAATR